MPEALWLWEAFLGLTAQRTFNQVGPQPLSWPCVESYGRMHGIDRYDMPFLAKCVFSLDHVYVQHQYAEMKKERDRQAQKNKGRGGGARRR